MCEKTCFNCSWMVVIGEKLYCVSEYRRQISKEESEEDASMCAGWREKRFLTREILIKVESDKDTFQRFLHLVRDLSKRNLDGKLIKDVNVFWRGQ